MTGVPGAVWVFWRGRDLYSGLDALTRRARARHLQPAGVPLDRKFDLSYYLGRRGGARPTVHPPLVPTLVEAFGPGPDLLDEAGLRSAWEAAEYGAILRSLAAEARGVADLYFRARRHAHTPAAVPAGTRRTPDARDLPPPPALTEREAAILDELLGKASYTRETRVTTPTVAVGCDGTTAAAASFKRPVVHLKSLGLVDTVSGCHGGVWLTATGAERARGNRAE